MTPKLFTALTLATAAATGITALALHHRTPVECQTCTQEIEDVAPPEHVYVTPHRHFARPPMPDMPAPRPSPAPVA